MWARKFVFTSWEIVIITLHSSHFVQSKQDGCKISSKIFKESSEFPTQNYDFGGVHLHQLINTIFPTWHEQNRIELLIAIICMTFNCHNWCSKFIKLFRSISEHLYFNSPIYPLLLLFLTLMAISDLLMCLDIDKVMINLKTEEFVLDGPPLQSLQQLIQWVGDFVLYLLANLPNQVNSTGRPLPKVMFLSILSFTWSFIPVFLFRAPLCVQGLGSCGTVRLWACSERCWWWSVFGACWNQAVCPSTQPHLTTRTACFSSSACSLNSGSAVS